VIVTCTSAAGDPDAQRCEADTSTGVLLQSSFGAAECVLGRNWGYDDQGVWVSEGCSGEFLVPLQEPESEHPEERWGFLDPGKGFLLGKGPAGQISLSAYGLVRYINQMPDGQTFNDHLGRERPVKTRQDIFSQRVLVWLSGWVGVPKLEYMITFWALNATNDSRLFANIGYNFNKHFKLYSGVNGNPGSRSVLGSHPYWLGHDRVMADELFRAFFTFGIWANGEIVPGLLQLLDRPWQHRPRSRSQVHLRRLRLVDAHDQGVRPARRLRRLGDAREVGHSLRILREPEPGAALSGHRDSAHQQRAEAGRQRQPVRDRRPGAGRHGHFRGLRAAGVRRRAPWCRASRSLSRTTRCRRSTPG
jgi:hypothetical protein